MTRRAQWLSGVAQWVTILLLAGFLYHAFGYVFGSILDGDPDPRFRYQQTVRITDGFFAGHEGTVRKAGMFDQWIIHLHNEGGAHVEWIPGDYLEPVDGDSE